MHVILQTQMLNLPKSVDLNQQANTSATAARSSYQKVLSAVPADKSATVGALYWLAQASQAPNHPHLTFFHPGMPQKRQTCLSD